MRRLFYICLILVFSGCAKIFRETQPILDKNKHKKLIKEEYEKIPLMWSSYMYFHDSTYQYSRNRDTILLTYQDSVLGIVKDALLKQDRVLIIHSDKLDNKVNIDINSFSYDLMPHRKFTDDMILMHIPDSNAYIFPIFTTSVRHNSRPSYGYTGGWLYSVSDAINILVYIIKDKQVIYKRACRLYGIRIYDAESPNKLKKRVEPQHWQLIIDKALEDYIKRLKPAPN